MIVLLIFTATELHKIYYRGAAEGDVDHDSDAA